MTKDKPKHPKIVKGQTALLVTSYLVVAIMVIFLGYAFSYITDFNWIPYSIILNIVLLIFWKRIIIKATSKPDKLSEERAFVKKPFFRRDPLTSIFAILGVFLVSQIIAAVLIGLYPAVQDWTEAQATTWLTESVAGQFFYVLFAEIIAIFLVMQLLKVAKITKVRIGLISPNLKDFGYALIAYGLYFVSYLAIILVARALLPSLDVDQEQQIGFEAAYTSWQLIMAFASLVILPPLAEEIMFRGFLFTSLRAKMRLRYAVILTSILFGIAHLQFGADAPLLWVAGIDTFVLSCFLCYLRERTGSLWPPIFLHAIKNTVAFMLLFGTRF